MSYTPRHAERLRSPRSDVSLNYECNYNVYYTAGYAEIMYGMIGMQRGSESLIQGDMMQEAGLLNL